MSSNRPINLKGIGFLFQPKTVIISNRYNIDDPTGQSVYDSFSTSTIVTQSVIDYQLNRELIWDVDENGLIRLGFQLMDRDIIHEYYTPEQLNNQFALMGAIYTFYNRVPDSEIL